MSVEDYIKNLPEDQQGNARKYESLEELLDLAKADGTPVSDEALAAIAGGASGESVNCGKGPKCKCGSTDLKQIDFVDGPYGPYVKFHCNVCGREFWWG